MRTTVKTDHKLSPLKLKKRQHLTVLLWNFVKSGTQIGEIIYTDKKIFTSEAKFNSQNDRVQAQHSENVPENMLTVYCHEKAASGMVWAAVSKTWNLLWFLWNRIPKSTQKCTSIICWPLCYVIWKSTSKIKVSPSNRTVLTLTPPINPKVGSKTISCGFGARNWGFLHRPILTQWSSVFGPCWKLKPVAHNTQLWSLWKCFWLKLGLKYSRKSCV